MEQTQHLPRVSVEDRYAAERPCPICSEVALDVTHLQGLPDYVKCGECSSVFVVDRASDRIMFGSISSDYPETSGFALKRWLSIDEISVRAARERSPAVDSPKDETDQPFDTGRAVAPDADRSPPFGLDQTEDTSASQEVEASEAAQPGPQPFEHFEPERGQRFRVIVTGEPEFPGERCAHCYRSPAPRRSPATGELDPPRSFEVPLCKVCDARATSQGSDERNARLIAHLSSVLVGAVLFVLTLALARLGAQLPMFLSVGVATVLGALGYGTAALFSLSRLPQFAPSADALYVQSTVLIQYRKKEDGLAFSWRNPRYADLFFSANQAQSMGEVTKVVESGRINPPSVTNR